jgi:hypothetical protein
MHAIYKYLYNHMIQLSKLNLGGGRLQMDNLDSLKVFPSCYKLL